jgi:ATP-binding cassette subfamily F protein uup
VRNFSTRIMRGDRIGLIGPNGSGKTTLLRMLLGEVVPDSGEVRQGANVEVAYYDQQREQLDLDATVFNTIGEGNDTVTANGRTRHVNAYLNDFLFSKERARSPVRALSGGERNRLLLARLFTRPANVLVLDEPTNDLDLETLELLEEVLAEWSGTLLLVSHDRVFLDNIVTSTIVFEGDGQVDDYVGGYEDWVRQRPQSRAAQPARLRQARPEAGERAAARAKRLSFNESRELAALPDRIDSLEAEHRGLNERIASADFYKEAAEAIRDALARADTLAEEITTAYERWNELQSRLG